MYPVMYPYHMVVPYCPLMYRVAPEPYGFTPVLNEEKDENYRNTKDSKDYKKERQEMDVVKEANIEAGYRCMRGEDETIRSEIDTGVQMPDASMQQAMSPEEILKMIEIHHPDIMRTMSDLRTPPATARQLILRILQVSQMYTQVRRR